MAKYSILDVAAAPVVGTVVNRLMTGNPREQFRWRRRMEAWKYGSGADYNKRRKKKNVDRKQSWITISSTFEYVDETNSSSTSSLLHARTCVGAQKYNQWFPCWFVGVWESCSGEYLKFGMILKLQTSTPRKGSLSCGVMSNPSAVNTTGGNWKSSKSRNNEYPIQKSIGVNTLIEVPLSSNCLRHNLRVALLGFNLTYIHQKSSKMKQMLDPLVAAKHVLYD